MRILSYLEKNPSSSAREISRYLDMTAANIRYHIDILKDEGFVQVTEKRLTGGAGRPILLYTLTPNALGSNIVSLLEGILASVENSPNGDVLIENTAQRLANDFSSLEESSINRLNRALKYLNDLKYHANWEVHPEGPQIEFRHCPYGKLAQSFPTLCQMDQELLSILLDASVVLTKKRSFGKNPYSSCIFHLVPIEHYQEGSERS